MSDMNEVDRLETASMNDLCSRRPYDPEIPNGSIAMWRIHLEEIEHNKTGMDAVQTLEMIFDGLDLGPFAVFNYPNDHIAFYVQASDEDLEEIENRFFITTGGKGENDVYEMTNGAIENGRDSIASMIEKHGEILTGYHKN